MCVSLWDGVGVVVFKFSNLQYQVKSKQWLKTEHYCWACLVILLGHVGCRWLKCENDHIFVATFVDVARRCSQCPYFAQRNGKRRHSVMVFQL